MSGTLSVHESEIARQNHADRWSKDLIGGPEAPTTSGFSLGLAEYHQPEFGEMQVHDDQEALVVISGVGQVTVAGEVIDVRPGSAVYVPPGAAHATRRTGADPVCLIYAHGAV
jgi:mannose-6-phosphate isomerase-like protein (cupin superfamily)